MAFSSSSDESSLCKYTYLTIQYRAEDAIDKVIAVNPDLKSKKLKDCNTLNIDLVGLKGILFSPFKTFPYEGIHIQYTYVHTYIHVRIQRGQNELCYVGYSPHLAIRLIQEFKVSNRYVCMHVFFLLHVCMYVCIYMYGSVFNIWGIVCMHVLSYSRLTQLLVCTYIHCVYI